jgi:uncharacterized protein YjdB
LTGVTIPDSVTSIGYSAFYGCSSLTSMIIPESVTIIGEWAFYGCTKLTNVIISESVTSVGGYAFAYCSSLENITIPENVTEIGFFAFFECIGLKGIVIPRSVTNIGAAAFYTINASSGYPHLTLTIYGYRGSYAETFANTNDISFVALDEEGGLTEPITSIKINSPAATSIPRYSTATFSVTLNPGASDEGLIWKVSDPSYATVDAHGTVTTYDKVGMVILIVEDPASGIGQRLVLRIS